MVRTQIQLTEQQARRLRAQAQVDAVSFATMRQSGVDDAFVFDQHFDQEGFTPVA